MGLWGGLLTDIQRDMSNGISRDCYVGSYLKQRGENGHEKAPGCGLTEDGWLRDTLLAYTAGTVLEAGSDTTASAIQSFILFMLSHPVCSHIFQLPCYVVYVPCSMYFGLPVKRSIALWGLTDYQPLKMKPTFHT